MITKIRRTTGLLVALLLATSFLTTDAAFASDIDSPFKKLFSGIASWYGTKFHGKRTASGSRYDMHELTCAHRTLPFGTKLIVENPTNGKKCEVTVTDRGPFHGKRVIDLSKAAADKLGLDGVGQVVCYLGKVVGKGIGGTAKGIGGTARETGETIANLPSNLGKVAKGIGGKARGQLSEDKEVAVAVKPMSKSTYRKQIERYYKTRELAFLERAQERRSEISTVDEQPM